MTSPQPRIMLWVDGDHVEIWRIGGPNLALNWLDLIRQWPGFVALKLMLFHEHVGLASVMWGPKAQCADPLAEAMHALAPLHLDWQDITTRSAVAAL